MEKHELDNYQKVDDTIEKLANAKLEQEDLLRDLEPSDEPEKHEDYGRLDCK